MVTRSVTGNEARFAWLASYPRSGNTWLRFLIASLTQGGRAIDINAPGLSALTANRSEFDEFFGIDSTLLTDDEINRARPRLFGLIAGRSKEPLILRKVHDRCLRNPDGQRMFPPEVSRGAVYIVRDPRDVAVSYAHFAGVGIDEAIRRMGDPDMAVPTRREHRAPYFLQLFGTWSQHVRSWLDDAGMPVHLVRYEDLIADAATELARVAGFLGLLPGAASEAAAAVRFEALRAQETERGFRELMNRETRFFRQGRAGAWRSVLSAAQADRLWKDHGEVMTRLGYL
jgi:aryl sulfotransferase